MGLVRMPTRTSCSCLKSRVRKLGARHERRKAVLGGAIRNARLPSDFRMMNLERLPHVAIDRASVRQPDGDGVDYPAMTPSEKPLAKERRRILADVGTIVNWARAIPNSSPDPRTRKSSRRDHRSTASFDRCWARSHTSDTAARPPRSAPQAGACDRDSARTGSRRSRRHRASRRATTRSLRDSCDAGRRLRDDRARAADKPANRAGTQRRRRGRPESSRSKWIAPPRRASGEDASAAHAAARP